MDSSRLDSSSLSDDLLFQNKLNYTSMDETLMSAVKNKTLKDYDKELKELKEENFNLKLRIYLIEEEKKDLTDKFNKLDRERGGEKSDDEYSPVINLQSHRKFSDQNASTNSLTSDDSTSNSNKPERPHGAPNRYIYDGDDEQKDIEIENLNQINFELEKTVESLRNELQEKNHLIESNRKEYENFKEKFQIFQLECEQRVAESLAEKFNRDLTEKLDDANQILFVKQRQYEERQVDYERQIDELTKLLQAKDTDIETLKLEKLKFIRDYKQTAVKQIDSLMEQLIAKENTIQDNQTSVVESCNKFYNSEIIQCQQQQLLTNPIKDFEFESINSKQHYQFIISDFENQLKLKENLLQKYILIVKDKDTQINQLINIGLLCNNKDLVSVQKLELFIEELRNNLNDKDYLFEKSLKEHIELIRQKDELILNLRLAQKQNITDLNKANEILFESENRIEQLQNEIYSLETKNSQLQHLILIETKKNQEIMADYKIELSEKDQLVNKLRSSVDQLREKINKKPDNEELANFYEQQIQEKDNLIADLNQKLEKMTNSLVDKVELKEEQIQIIRREADEKLSCLIKENNQLKADCNKANMELEKLESRFTMQVDEYELEIENLSNKLKEKENTVKKLIQSAEEKDDIIVKLKIILSETLESQSRQQQAPSEEVKLSSTRVNLDAGEFTKVRKLEGLLRLIQEKNQQIESLKSELTEFRSSQQPAAQHQIKLTPNSANNNNNSTNSSTDLNSCMSSHSALNSSMNTTNTMNAINKKTPNGSGSLLMVPKSSSSVSFQFSSHGSASIKMLANALEREIEIYKNLNSNDKNENVDQCLSEIKSLRNQLLKLTIIKQSKLVSASSEDINNNVNMMNMTSGGNRNDNESPLASFSYQWTSPDSGVESQKSDMTVTIGNENRHTFTTGNRGRASSIPRPVPGSSDVSAKSSFVFQRSASLKLDELAYSNFSRDELINLLKQLNSENSIIKRQLENKAPKVTEIHNEVSSLREKLNAAEKINDYLRKQIELYHITHNNTESLLEMAQKLNLTKDELEQYKEKLNKIQELNDSYASNNRRDRAKPADESCNSDSSSSPSVHMSRNIKFTISTLEAQLDEWKNKYHKLEQMFNNSERLSRYLALKFNKYSPMLRELAGDGKASANLSRWLSTPSLGTDCGVLRMSCDVTLGDVQLDKLVTKYLAEMSPAQASDVCTPRSSHGVAVQEQLESHERPTKSKFELERLKLKVDKLKQTLAQKELLIDDYFKRLAEIYVGFKNLKANVKYLKLIFGEPLIELFKTHCKDQPTDSEHENHVHNIFSGAFVKFDELNKKLDDKEQTISELKRELETLRVSSQKRNAPVEETMPKYAAFTVNTQDLSRSMAQTVSAPFSEWEKCHVTSASGSASADSPRSLYSTTSTLTQTEPIQSSASSTLANGDRKSTFDVKFENLGSGSVFAKKDDYLKLREYLVRTKINLIELVDRSKQLNGINTNEFTKCVELSKNDLDVLDALLTNSFSFGEYNESKLAENSSELKNKLKKYREEIIRLKDKIKLQNQEVEEALNQLMLTNREKENTKLLLSKDYKNDLDDGRFSTDSYLFRPTYSNGYDDNLLNDKLSKTHSRLIKARDNIKNKMDEQYVYAANADEKIIGSYLKN